MIKESDLQRLNALKAFNINGGFENGTYNWFLSDNANANFTFDVSPLESDSTWSGNALGKLTVGAANLEGEYLSHKFTIGEAHKSQMLSLRGFSRQTTNYVTGYIRVEVWTTDLTVNKYIHGSGFDLSATNSYANFGIDFQSDPDSLEYEVRFIINTTEAVSYEVTIDDLKITTTAPNVRGLAGWREYSLNDKITSSSGTLNYIHGRAYPYKTLDGTWRMSFNIKVGYTSAIGSGSISIAGIETYSGVAHDVSATMYSGVRVGSAQTSSAADGTILFYIITGVDASSFGFSGDIPLASKPDWAVDYSNVVLSSSTSGREIVTNVRKSSGQAFDHDGGVAVSTKIVIDSLIEDTTNSWDAANSWYIVPEDGYYDIYGIQGGYASSGVFPSTAYPVLNVYIDGSSLARGVTTTYTGSYTFYNSEISLNSVKLTRGQKIEYYLTPVGSDITSVSTTMIRTESYRCNYVISKRNSGNQTIAKEPKVYVSAQNTSGQTIPDSTQTTITGWTELRDTNNCFDATTGVFTADRDLEVEAHANIHITISTSTSDIYTLGRWLVNGSAVSTSIPINSNGSLSLARALAHSYYQGPLNKGDTLEFAAIQTSGASTTMYSGISHYNTLFIKGE